MQAIILAAGKGTRLMPLTEHTHKSLVLLAGKPILGHIVESLPEQVTEVIIIVGHRAEQIRDTIGDEYLGKMIRYVVQGERGGTGGALHSAAPYITEPFLIMNGDDLHHPDDIKHLLTQPRSASVQVVTRPGGYRTVVTGSDQIFTDLVHPNDDTQPVLTFTGLHYLDPEFFNLELVAMPNGEYSIPDTLFRHRREYPLTIHTVTRSILINTLEELERAEKLLANL